VTLPQHIALTAICFPQSQPSHKLTTLEYERDHWSLYRLKLTNYEEGDLRKKRWLAAHCQAFLSAAHQTGVRATNQTDLREPNQTNPDEFKEA